MAIANGMGMGMTSTLPKRCSMPSIALGLSRRYQLSSPRLVMHHRSYNSYLRVTCESAINRVAGPTEWTQKTFSLPPFARGCHIITRYIYEAVPEIKQFEVGLANLFILHTSASLTVNENASSDVPLDMEDSLNRIVPEGNHYRHLDEGYDDMPAHVKASMMGCSLTIPVRAGRFHLGIWQGIWLNEHRNYGGPRQICITLHGTKGADGRKYT
uniref:Secondary thiamine-phosphate synthase enzyme n=1 Tax=Araucaria cunninghamii TaxID=56994 RepID=A0A0D6R4V2_ARACU